MKKIIFSSLLLVGILAFACSCEEERFIYDGPDYVEFSPIRDVAGSDGKKFSFQYYNTRCYYHNYNIAPQIGLNTFKIQLIGPQRSTPINVKYVIKEYVYYDKNAQKIFANQPEGVETTDWVKIYSTATAGVNYNSPAEGAFQIPANSSFGSFEIDVLTNTDNANTKTSKMIFIELADTDDVRGNALSNVFMLCFGKRNAVNPTIF